jgi:hypothetical protein
MTILAHDQSSFSKSFPTSQVTTQRLDPDFVVVGLVSLLGLAVSALALASRVTIDLEAIAPFLG